MNKIEFNAFWWENFPGVNTISYQLKTSLKDRWFRVHSLPESKRYPGNESEMKIILERQNTIITDLIGDQNFFILLITYGDNKQIYRDTLDIDNFIEIDGIIEYNNEPDESDDWYRNQTIKFLKWQEGILDPLLLKVADAEYNSPIIIELQNKRLISPYDGGMDIIMENPDSKVYFKNKYKDWLPKNVHGL